MTDLAFHTALPSDFPADFADGWRTGVAYYRISDDPEHDELGVKRQQRATRAKAERERIFLVAEYLDDDRSAFVSKRRPGYEAYLEHAGRVDVAMAWHPDRMTRGNLIEIERLILALGGDEGTPIVTCETGDYDVSTPHGRMIARITGSVARYESEHKSRRLGAKMAELAHEGKVHGGRRAFGYSPDGRQVDPVEAEVVRDLVRRVIGGANCRELAAELNANGVRTAAGNDWHPNALKAVIAGTRIVGLRTYKGEVVAKAEWPAIISADEHALVVAMLATRAPVGRRGRTPWLLTGLLRCEVCGASLSSNTDTGGTRRYVCRKAPGYKGCGGVGIKAEPVEERLADLVALRLVDLDGRGPEVDDGSADRAELDRIACERIEVTESGLSFAARSAEHAALDRRQSAVEGRLAAAVRQTSPLAFVIAEGYQGRPWASLEIAERRVVLHALIDHVTVGKATKRGSTAVELSRVDGPGRIVWKA